MKPKIIILAVLVSVFVILSSSSSAVSELSAGQVSEQFHSGLPFPFVNESDLNNYQYLNLTIKKNESLSGDIYARNLIIDSGVNVLTNGYNLFVENLFMNNGTIITGESYNFTNYTLSIGGSGGGGGYSYDANNYYGNAGLAGYSTEAKGGNGSGTIYSQFFGLNGSTPDVFNLSISTIAAWFNATPIRGFDEGISQYLAGASGGLSGNLNNSGASRPGSGAWGIYIQGGTVYPGEIIASGYPSTGGGAGSGGGGGGAVVIGYSNLLNTNSSLSSGFLNSDWSNSTYSMGPLINTSGGSGESAGVTYANNFGGNGGSGNIMFFEFNEPSYANETSPLGSGTYYVPITITNNASSPTPGIFQQEIVLDALNFSFYEDGNLNNIFFYYPNGTTIPAWIQSGDSNISTHTIIWLRMFSIPAYGSALIYLGFDPRGTNLFETHITGISSTISNSSGYDNGNDVFLEYGFFQNTNDGWSTQVNSGSFFPAATEYGLEMINNQLGESTYILPPKQLIQEPVIVEESWNYSGGNPYTADANVISLFGNTSEIIGAGSVGQTFGGGSLADGDSVYTQFQYYVEQPDLMIKDAATDQILSQIPFEYSSPNHLLTYMLMNSTFVQSGWMNFNSSGELTASAYGLSSYNSTSAYGNFSLRYPTLMISAGTGAADSYQYIQWVIVRSLPPNNEMPGFRFGKISSRNVYSVTFQESGLMNGTEWGVDVSGSDFYSHTASLGISIPNGSYDFSVLPVRNYTVSPAAGAINVEGSNATESLAFVQENLTNVTTVKAGEGSDFLLSDPVNGYVYVANYISGNINVVNGTDIIKNISVGDGPDFMLYDSFNNMIYVSNYLSNNVTIINATTNEVTGSVSVGNGPDFIALDPETSYIAISNYISNNVTFIDNNVSVYSVAVGQEPDYELYLPQYGYILVSNYGSSNLSVISGEYVFQSIGVKAGPKNMILVGNCVYVACEIADAVEEVCFNTSTSSSVQSTDQTTSSINSDGAGSTAIGSGGDYYVSSGGGSGISGTVSVGTQIQPFLNLTLENGVLTPCGDGKYTLTFGLGVNSSSNTVGYGILNASEMVSIVGQVAASLPAGFALGSNSSFYVTETTGNFINEEAASFVMGLISLGLSPGSSLSSAAYHFAKFLVGNGLSYLMDNEKVTGYLLTLENLYKGLNLLTNPGELILDTVTTLANEMLSSVIQTSESLVLQNGVSFDVNGSSLKPAYIIAPSQTIEVVIGNISGVPSDFPVESNLTYAFSSGGLILTPFTNFISRTVDSSRAQIHYQSESGYTLTINSNLPSGTLWNATVNGTTYEIDSQSLNVSGLMGLIHLSIQPPAGYIPDITAMNLAMCSDQGITVTFIPYMYNVTFTEDGLPAGQSWSVSSNGITESSSGNAVTLSVPNGTYTFTDYSSGYTGQPQNGTFRVNGHNVSLKIGFLPVIPQLKYTEKVIPVGTDPVYMIADPVNCMVYVANEGSNNVSVISGSSVVATISVGNSPVFLVFDPANDYIYVANYGSGTVSVINPAIERVIANIQVGKGPDYMIALSDGDVYVANYLSGSYSVISGSDVVGGFTLSGAPVMVSEMSIYSPMCSAAYGLNDGKVYTVSNISRNEAIFSEHGLDPGSGWYVSIYSPVTGAQIAYKESSSPNISFNLIPTYYNYSFGSVYPYYRTENATGQFVLERNITIEANFTSIPWYDYSGFSVSNTTVPLTLYEASGVFSSLGINVVVNITTISPLSTGFACAIHHYFGVSIGTYQQKFFSIFTVEDLSPFFADLYNMLDSSSHNLTSDDLGLPGRVSLFLYWGVNSTISDSSFLSSFESTAQYLEQQIMSLAKGTFDPLSSGMSAIVNTLGEILNFANVGIGILENSSYNLMRPYFSISLLSIYDELNDLQYMSSLASKSANIMMDILDAVGSLETVALPLYYMGAAAMNAIDLVIEYVEPSSALAQMATLVTDAIDPNGANVSPAVTNNGSVVLGYNTENGSTIWESKYGFTMNLEGSWLFLLSKNYSGYGVILYHTGTVGVSVPYLIRYYENLTDPAAVSSGTISKPSVSGDIYETTVNGIPVYQWNNLNVTEVSQSEMAVNSVLYLNAQFMVSSSPGVVAENVYLNGMNIQNQTSGQLFNLQLALNSSVQNIVMVTFSSGRSLGTSYLIYVEPTTRTVTFTFADFPEAVHEYLEYGGNVLGFSGNFTISTDTGNFTFMMMVSTLPVPPAPPSHLTPPGPPLRLPLQLSTAPPQFFESGYVDVGASNVTVITEIVPSVPAPLVPPMSLFPPGLSTIQISVSGSSQFEVQVFPGPLPLFPPTPPLPPPLLMHVPRFL